MITFNLSLNILNMNNIFESCSGLTSIDLSKFDTSNVEDMTAMFTGCYSLRYLDLSNFDTSKVTSIYAMFHECSSLIYLNLKSFKLNNTVSKFNAFERISSYVTYCIEDQETIDYLGINSNCDNDYFKDNIKIGIENNKYTENCTKYEYNNICYDECPDNSYPLYCYDNNCENNVRECFDNVPVGYYLDIDINKYKKCYETCKSCYGEGNETINNCIKCKYNLIYNDKNSNCSEENKIVKQTETEYNYLLDTIKHTNNYPTDNIGSNNNTDYYNCHRDRKSVV